MEVSSLALTDKARQKINERFGHPTFVWAAASGDPLKGSSGSALVVNKDVEVCWLRPWRVCGIGLAGGVATLIKHFHDMLTTFVILLLMVPFVLYFAVNILYTSYISHQFKNV